LSKQLLCQRLETNQTYDNEDELTSAIGKESGGTANRGQEQFGYLYDPFC
jgi:hypothetical protein